jgi:hypothetical protein
MRNPFRKPTRITRQLVPQDQQAAVTKELFRIDFNLGQVLQGFALSLASDYQSSRWYCYSLSNGGMYLCMDGSQSYRVTYDSGCQGELTPDALSIACGLLAYNSLSFCLDLALADNFDRCYFLLREYAMEHGEAANIVEAMR